LISERVTNWSRPSPLTAYVVVLHFSHASDPALVRQVLLAVAAAHPDVLPEPEAEVEFVEAGVTGLRFQLQVWSKTHLKSAGKLKSDLNFEIWRQLTERGMAIPQSVQVIQALPTVQSGEGELAVPGARRVTQSATPTEPK
jgi:small-conductance mechanosensitive channel